VLVPHSFAAELALGSVEASDAAGRGYALIPVMRSVAELTAPAVTRPTEVQVDRGLAESPFVGMARIHVKGQLTRFVMAADNCTWSQKGRGRSMKTSILSWLTIPAALLMLCCGNADLPPAEGAAGITVRNTGDSTAGLACGASHTLVLGGAAPTPVSKGATWVDGQDGHSVTCSVTGGGTFALNGEINGEAMNFRISGTVTSGGTGTASVGLFDPDPKLSLALADSACTIRADSSFTVEKGSIYAAVSCSHLTALEDRYLWCAADGVFVFRNCVEQ